jgi:predicted transcriptional regulator
MKERKKPAEHKFSRRERQIMDAVYRLGNATAVEIVQNIPDPPTKDAVRRMIRILEEKGHLKHKEEGQHYLYSPTVAPEKMRRNALDHVLQTHFRGSISAAIASLLEQDKSGLPEDELEEIVALIEKNKKEGK